jgi:hypothetical protein
MPDHDSRDERLEPVSEREKWQTDVRIREREMELKEREQQSREEELKVKREESRRSRWSNPLIIAIAAAAGAAFTNIYVAWHTSREQHILEREKAEATRVLEVLKAGDPDKVAINLEFLLDSGLNSDPQGKLKAFLATRKRGEGPALPASSPVAAPAPSDISLFDNWNKDAVGKEPPSHPTEFSITQDHYITFIANYHWNGGFGKLGGKIRLERLEDGKTYVACDVITGSGQSNAPNVNWICTPNVRIPAGTYKVIDSDVASWSQNNMSGGQGFSRVRGYPVSQ